MQSKPTVLDLFCGCGGLSLGFIQAGFDVKLGIDAWQDAIKTYTATHQNTQGIVADLFTTTPEQISQQTQINQIDVIIGGPPCQGFSIAGKRMIDDERNQLYKSFVEFVRFYRPKAFLMENVPNMMSMGKGLIKEQITQDFEQLGYTVSSQILMASDFGIPQNRRRAFFVGFKNGTRFEFPQATVKQHITAEQAISDLPDYSVADGENYPLSGSSNYQQQMRQNSTGLFNHQITVHNDKTKEIIALVPDGGNYKNLPEHLRQTRNVNIAWTRLNSQKPSFTIDTGHNHHFHYQFNRVPTVRESARIQSFPDDFIFLGTKTSQLRQVGNAVPPMLAKAIAEKMKLFL
ncbi:MULTISPECIES: DNA cytosine methyltransferase [Kingella]|nr:MULTISPECIES: DNA cytosine methyltransferase [Kingella]MDK4624336.1 DNA cytosine methyltransferase [Kingella kingae]MDK4659931.1 DNA cytosine methyltransferase [Kingella kingae]MDK4667858.1 DNA cytosine methyltransferase [Kingella kingae]MDK4686220.1 DNA cytosine methyltransferase [Kingella kingae]MDK4687689.1 DNA cytosine methyltransferase [Kingella negevensis]